MHKIAQLSCKILGLYTIINSIASLSTIVFIPQGTPPGILRMIFPSIVQVIVGLFLWLFADTLACLMIPTDYKNEPVSRPNETTGQKIAFSVLGLYFVGTSLPKLVSAILTVLTTPSQVQIAQPSITYRLLVESIIQLLVGLIIFLGSNGLVGLLNTLRNAGLPKDKIE